MKEAAFLVALLSASAILASDPIDLEFMDSGNTKYRTTTVSADLRRDFHFINEKVKVFLIETPSLDNNNYKEQNGVLNALGHMAETYQVLYVVACPSAEYKHGYHTSTEEAKKLMGASNAFRVRLLSSSGVVRRESNKPISAEELTRWFEE